MRVLSLFDGMSCGQIALKEIGITPEVYYASEIDKFAIKQTQLNFPNTIQVGDVRDLNVENLVLKQFRKIILFYKYQEDLTKVDFMKIRLQHYLVIHMIETILSYREHYMAISE